ncbi:MAG: hypothetical protein QXS54_03110 [Candidatus Methanomethylicaceae archaeon]
MRQRSRRSVAAGRDLPPELVAALREIIEGLGAWLSLQGLPALHKKLPQRARKIYEVYSQLPGSSRDSTQQVLLSGYNLAAHDVRNVADHSGLYAVFALDIVQRMSGVRFSKEAITIGTALALRLRTIVAEIA